MSRIMNQIIVISLATILSLLVVRYGVSLATATISAMFDSLPGNASPASIAKAQVAALTLVAIAGLALTYAIKSIIGLAKITRLNFWKSAIRVRINLTDGRHVDFHYDIGNDLHSQKLKQLILALETDDSIIEASTDISEKTSLLSRSVVSWTISRVGMWPMETNRGPVVMGFGRGEQMPQAASANL